MTEPDLLQLFQPPRVGMIAALSPDGIIGQRGKIPWRYPGDMRRFKRVTTSVGLSAVIMGRKTFESMGCRALPGRANIVVSRTIRASIWQDVEWARSVGEAIRQAAELAIWIIGGREVYEEGMAHARLLDITSVPDAVPADGPDTVHFPPIDPALWDAGPRLPHEDEPRLTRRIYLRRSP